MDKGIRIVSSLLILTVLYALTSAKPTTDVKQGPCVGMDCLHGVLMHGDAEQGGDHKAEDQYLRFQETLKTAGDQPGPANAEDEYHGVLMHGDSETGTRQEEVGEILPEIVKQEALPKDMNVELHEGMHGDGRVGKHDWDNAGTDRGSKDTDDHEKIMHGLLMHGDENYGKHDSESSDTTENDNGNKGPLDHGKLMHGLLLHGDTNGGEHEAEDPSEQPAGDVGPRTAEDQLHGLLMHGDTEPGKHHVHNDDIQEVNKGGRMSGPTSDQLHGILMHGDSEIGHDHAQEDADTISEVFRDFSKILELEIDADILKMIDLEKILKTDIEEYVEWQANAPTHEDTDTMGSTYVDKSILDDIQLMKQRYLNRDDAYPFNADVDPDDADTFTAEDAKSVLKDRAHTGEGEDMRHDLELMGNTDPINDRHGKKHFH